MRILGVDPGTVFTGYGIVDYENNQLKYVAAGVIKLSPADEMAARLEQIYKNLNVVIRKHKPDEFALETAFYGKNVQSALKIGYARGVSLLAASQSNLAIKEYSPREVKKSVTGNGASTKEQVQYMIVKLLALRPDKMKLDESDALAVAICHAFKMNSAVKKSKNWKEFIRENPDRIIF